MEWKRSHFIVLKHNIFVVFHSGQDLWFQTNRSSIMTRFILLSLINLSLFESFKWIFLVGYSFECYRPAVPVFGGRKEREN